MSNDEQRHLTVIDPESLAEAGLVVGTPKRKTRICEECRFSYMVYRPYSDDDRACKVFHRLEVDANPRGQCETWEPRPPSRPWAVAIRIAWTVCLVVWTIALWRLS